MPHCIRILATAAFAALSAGAALAQPSFTSEQAKAGFSQYVEKCDSCHGDKLDGGVGGGPPLQGSYFFNLWGDQSVGNVFDYIKTQMPADTPGSLSGRETAQILAYILEFNGLEAGEQPMPPTSAELQDTILANP